MTKAESRQIARIATMIERLAPSSAVELRRIAAPKRRPSMPRHPSVEAAKVRKLAGRKERRDRVAAIREAVFARAGGRCEGYHVALSASENPKGARCTGPAVEWDHWHGGFGKRRSMESVRTTWALCVSCHLRRTRNQPDASYWNASFEIHCNTHGYRFTPHYDARAASREACEPRPDPAAASTATPRPPHASQPKPLLSTSTKE